MAGFHLGGALVALALLAQAADAADGPGAARVRDGVRAWRQAHERQVIDELAALLALPNVAAVSVDDLRRNADLLQEMLRRRGFETRILTAGAASRPAVYGELRVPGADRTVVFYAHYDGQPARPEGWSSDPWKPVIRTGPPGAPGTREVDLARHQGPLDGEWRIYARSASDDKSPIVAFLAALDALRAAGISPSVNLKVFLEGEEEDGSPHLTDILRAHAGLLAADAWVLGDGPVHQTRRMQLYFGARGVTSVNLTVYGPLRPLHSGHYGNWAPNPAVLLAHLLAGLRDAEGKILIPGFYDDVRPLGETERRAAAAMPAIEEELRRELGLARSEADGRLQDRVMLPALNLRAFRAGGVEGAAPLAVPAEAWAAIDFRLVPDQTPEKVRQRLEDHLRREGWHLVSEPPDAGTRRTHPKIVRIVWNPGYPPARTDMDAPASRAVTAVVEQAVGGPVVRVPSLGGSLPLYLFTETLAVPVVGVPMVNHDNNQHAADENLRLQNLWDGIEIYAALIARLGEEWKPADKKSPGVARAVEEGCGRSASFGGRPALRAVRTPSRHR
jgi:acetylornithine deacetylase/succinyl-diaminopimelate desuccinylase-like protein